eukprot:gene5196-3712_t
MWGFEARLMRLAFWGFVFLVGCHWNWTRFAGVAGFAVNLAQFSDQTTGRCTSLASETTLQDNTCTFLSFGGSAYYVKVDCATSTKTSAWTMNIYAASAFQCLDTANYLLLSGTLADDSCATARLSAYNLFQTFIVRCDGSAIVPTQQPTPAPSTPRPTRLPTTAAPSFAPSYPPELSYAATLTSYASSQCDSGSGSLQSSVFDSGSVGAAGNCSALPLLTTTDDGATWSQLSVNAQLHCSSLTDWTLTAYDGAGCAATAPALFSASSASVARVSATCATLSQTLGGSATASRFYFDVSCAARFRSAAPSVVPSRAPTRAPTTRAPSTAAPSLSLRPSTVAPSVALSSLARVRLYLASPTAAPASTQRRLAAASDSAAAVSCARNATTTFVAVAASLVATKETCLGSAAFTAALTAAWNASASNASASALAVLSASLGSLSVRCGRSNVGGTVFDWRATWFTRDDCATAADDASFTFYGAATCACTTLSTSAATANAPAALVAAMRRVALMVDCDQTAPTSCDAADDAADDAASGSSAAARPLYETSPLGFSLLIVVVGSVALVALLNWQRFVPAAWHRIDTPPCLAALYASESTLCLAQCVRSRVVPCVRALHGAASTLRAWSQFARHLCRGLRRGLRAARRVLVRLVRPTAAEGEPAPFDGDVAPTAAVAAAPVRALVDGGGASVEEVATWNIVALVVAAEPLGDWLRRELQRQPPSPAAVGSPFPLTRRSVYVTPPLDAAGGAVVSAADGGGSGGGGGIIVDCYDVDRARRASAADFAVELAAAAAAATTAAAEDTGAEAAANPPTLLARVALALRSRPPKVYAASDAVQLAPLQPPPSSPSPTRSTDAAAAATSPGAATPAATRDTAAVSQPQDPPSHGSSQRSLRFGFTASFAALPFVSSWRIVPSATDATHATHATHAAATLPSQLSTHLSTRLGGDGDGDGDEAAEEEEEEDVVHAYDERADDVEAGGAAPFDETHYDTAAYAAGHYGTGYFDETHRDAYYDPATPYDTAASYDEAHYDGGETLYDTGHYETHYDTGHYETHYDTGHYETHYDTAPYGDDDAADRWASDWASDDAAARHV